MIRRPENVEGMKLNILLKSGGEYRGVDTTQVPFGEHDRIVAFWYKDRIRVIPLEQVDFVEMFFDEEQPVQA